MLFPHVPRTSPLSSSVFHAACALSAPTGHLPRKGGWRYENTLCSKTPRRFPIFMRRTTPSNLLNLLNLLPLFRSIKGQHAPYPLSHLCYNRENHALHERTPR